MLWAQRRFDTEMIVLLSLYGRNCSSVSKYPNDKAAAELNSLSESCCVDIYLKDEGTRDCANFTYKSSNKVH